MSVSFELSQDKSSVHAQAQQYYLLDFLSSLLNNEAMVKQHSTIHKKKLTRHVTFVLIVLVVLAVLILKTISDKKLLEANHDLSDHQYSDAVKNYNLAFLLWPFNRNPDEIEQAKIAANAIRQYESSPFLIIFLNSNTSRQSSQQLQNEIEAIPGVTQTIYTSSQTTYDKYKEQNKDKPELLNLVTVDLFPASLEVKVSQRNNKALQDKIYNVAKGKSFVSNVVRSPISPQ
ncbi:MAG TPA: permease-like cell division protein FtsX [Patescibacteria group bacterium]|nr:permease-like cell division protein FtsX [Patescibacteria group bacterium]